ncbi:TauD/TfdA family dioxygenase [Geodermatophilus sp. CPCC 206100]|uniref:TauD/TfdA family dioxygenase n=1 Tax=Geodermatophilus sp. CPCC 206100 TaxID=3020054 RepID=UPI003B00FDE5
MSTPTLLDLELRGGRVPVLRAEPGPDAAGWAATHRAALRAAVTEHGAVLVRGLALADAGTTAAVVRGLGADPVAEREAFAPRTPLPGGLYSSTPWPATQPMCMHHELSYTLEPPGLLAFACLTAPTTGGATGLADAPSVLAALPPDLVARVEREGWLLVRTYTDEIGASVEDAFGTADRDAVERTCRAAGIDTEWLPDGGLRTRQRRRGVVGHPVTGARCWFNQIAFLNEWTLDPEVREYLVDVYGEEGLPFTTRFGDGGPIGADVVAEINAVYESATVREPWQAGDLLLVDNVRTAHSREPFTGPREVVVALADPVRLPAVSPSAEGGPR